MICITCEHVCHCGDTCQIGNGCGCLTCEHVIEEDSMLKKIWKKIKSWIGLV